MEQKTFDILDGLEIDLDLRQEIWVIMGPDEFIQTVVRGFECVLLGSKNNDLSLIPKKVITGKLLIYMGSSSYYEEDDDYMESIVRQRIVTSKEESEKAVKNTAVWLNDDEWEKAVGDVKRQNNENCELKCCCGNISTIRDMFMHCRRNNGLIQFDIDSFKNLLLTHEPPKERNILDKILKQLGLEWTDWD